MKLKNFLRTISLLIIILFSLTIPIHAQLNKINDYKLKKGDSIKYVFSSFEMKKSSYLSIELYQYYNSGVGILLSAHNLTKEDSFNFTIVKSTPTGVTVNESVDIPGIGIWQSIVYNTTSQPNSTLFLVSHSFSSSEDYLTSQIIFNSVTQGFNNYTSAYNYFGLIENNFKGDYYTYKDNSSGPGINYKEVYKWNWKTGWLENFQYNTKINNLVLMNFVLQRDQSPSLLDKMRIYFNDLLNLATIFILITIPIVIGISYIRYKKGSKKLQNKRGFTKYLLNQIKHTKQENNVNTPTLSKKSLEIIEEIIQENQ